MAAATSPALEALASLIADKPSVIGRMDLSRAADPEDREKMTDSMLASARGGHQRTNDCLAALLRERQGTPRVVVSSALAKIA